MAANPGGIFSDVLSRIGIGKLSTPPQMSQDGFEIVLTETELLQGFTAGMDAKTRGYVTVKLEPGRMIIRMKL